MTRHSTDFAIDSPVTSVTTGSLAPQGAAAASRISNMLRNLGGAIGTASLAIVITKREQFHSNVIGQSRRRSIIMKKIMLVAAIASLSIVNPGAASAQAAIGEPGLYAFYHPDGDVLHAGSRPYADPRNAMASEPVARPARRHGRSVRPATH